MRPAGQGGFVNDSACELDTGAHQVPNKEGPSFPILSNVYYRDRAFQNMVDVPTDMCLFSFIGVILGYFLKWDFCYISKLRLNPNIQILNY